LFGEWFESMQNAHWDTELEVVKKTLEIRYQQMDINVAAGSAEDRKQ